MIKDKMFNDLAELAGGAMGIWSAIREQMRDEIRDRVDQMSGRLDLATRADIDRLEGMIAKLRVRLDALDGHKVKTTTSHKTRSDRSTTAKARTTAKPTRTRKK